MAPVQQDIPTQLLQGRVQVKRESLGFTQDRHLFSVKCGDPWSGIFFFYCSFGVFLYRILILSRFKGNCDEQREENGMYITSSGLQSFFFTLCLSVFYIIFESMIVAKSMWPAKFEILSRTFWHVFLLFLCFLFSSTVLASFISTWYYPKSSEKEGPRLRKCIHTITL